jgi:hypothetical protein
VTTRTSSEGGPFTITAGLHKIGNQTPYFSVTAWAPRIRIGNRVIGDWGGCCHKEVLAAVPELAPVVAMHLSHEDGSPMHTEDNGLYHLGFSVYKDAKNLRYAAEHFRCSEAQAEILANSTKEDIVTWIAQQRQRWKAEADAAIELLDRLIAEK